MLPDAAGTLRNTGDVLLSAFRVMLSSAAFKGKS
jgi:hypothetical protein